MYELDLNVHPQTRNELPTSRLSKVIVLQTDRQTYIHTQSPNLLPHRFASDSKSGEMWLDCVCTVDVGLRREGNDGVVVQADDGDVVHGQ